MLLKQFLDIKPEAAEALKENKPVVALESTILSHGMPYPENLRFAEEIEETVRRAGAVPATIALIGGRVKIGLEKADLELMCRAENVGKVSRRDFAVYIAEKRNGATTVASTMICAAMAGIKVFATGGIGGVHRGGESSMDISADLEELSHTPIAVVCAGCKQVLDIGRTLEYLETKGVPVLGYKTKDFPAFYCRKSGYESDYALEDAEDAARIIKTSEELGLGGGILIANPVPSEYAMDFSEMEAVIEKALEDAERAKVRGKDITPFLLAKIVELTEGKSLRTNIRLALNNARLAAEIAVELSGMNA